MSKFNKKLSKSRSGVSDIIGNLLILAITVSLFSTVLFFVTSMPAPAQATFTDMDPSLSNIEGDATPYHIWVNVTHKGGQALMEWSTGIYIFLDGTYMGELQISDGANDLGDKWEVGEVWAYSLSLVSHDIQSLSMMIVDKNVNSIVWQSDLIGGETSIPLPPIITERWTDPEIGIAADALEVHVKVVDPNDDMITSVTLDLSSLDPAYPTVFPLTNHNGEWYDELPNLASYSWNKKTIQINATDETGLYRTALMTIRVNPSGDSNDNNYTNGDGFGNFDLSGLQGFAIFEWSEWDEKGLAATQQKEFVRTAEDAVVVMISKLVVNTEKENTFQVLNPINKQVLASVSSVSGNDFDYYGHVAGYYIYNVTIHTSELPDISSYYSVSAVITDSYQPTGHSLRISSEIFVAMTDSETPGYPKLFTYNDSSFTNATTEFSTYSPTNNKIYVEVQTDLSNPYILDSGNVEIRDFYWNAQLKRTVASPFQTTSSLTSIASTWNGPVSNLWQVLPVPAEKAPGTYRFVINLQNATEAYPWIPGENSYVLRFDVFKTTGETHLLNEVIHVDSPKTKLDLVVGSLPSSSSNSAWSGLISLLYYSNDNSWGPPTVLVSTASKIDYSPEAKVVRAGDMNGDGRGDAIAVIYDSVYGAKGITNVYAFISQPNGGWLQSIIIIDLFPTTGEGPLDFNLEIGNVDQDDDLDVVMTYNGQLWLYRNDGMWTRRMIDNGMAGIEGLQLGDMDPPDTEGNDPERSMDIVVANGGEFRIYRNTDLIGSYDVDDMIQLSGASAQLSDYAISEETINGTVSSYPVNFYSYLNTHGAPDPQLYELITEEETITSLSIYPEHTDESIDTVPDAVTDLDDSDDQPYTVGYDDVAAVLDWDQTGVSETFATLNVKFVVNYTTNGYDAGDRIEWYDSVNLVWMPMMTIENTNGAYNISEWDLTSYFPTAVDLPNLRVRFVNTGDSEADTVEFYSWKINTSWVVGDGLEHIWRFQVTPGTDQIFSVFAAMNEVSTDGDTFVFQYSTDMSTWLDLVTINSINFGAPKTISLPEAVSGAVYVRVIDTNDVINNDPDLNGIKVSQMYIETLATTTDIGDVIQSFDLADVDGDGSTDIVVGTYHLNKKERTGQIWVLYNSVFTEVHDGVLVTTSGIFRSDNHEMYYQSAVNGPLTIDSWTVVAGSFFNPYEDQYLDIMFADSNDVYAIDLTDRTTYSTLLSMNFMEPTSPITVMLATDVDGNRRCDLIFGTLDGRIIMWANYEGYTTSFGWQSYLVDDLSDSVNSMDAATFAI